MIRCRGFESLPSPLTARVACGAREPEPHGPARWSPRATPGRIFREPAPDTRPRKPTIHQDIARISFSVRRAPKLRSPTDRVVTRSSACFKNARCSACASCPPAISCSLRATHSGFTRRPSGPGLPDSHEPKLALLSDWQTPPYSIAHPVAD
jgi:hypothetical protein